MAFENSKQLNNSKEFFYEIVEPDFKDFCNNSLNIRCAIHSVFSMTHMAEWYYYDNSGKPERVFTLVELNKFLCELKAQCIYYRLISDVANAYKHFEITKYAPLSLNKQPIIKHQLPYPESLLETDGWAMGEPSTVFMVNYKDAKKEGKMSLKIALGRIINLWKTLIDEPNCAIEKTCKNLFSENQ